MGIQVEFNPDLTLRKSNTFGRLEEECLPENLEIGKIYKFLKRGQRNYWLEDEIPLLKTKENGQLSRPLASIIILEVTHFVNPKDNQICTKGLYEVKEVYELNDNKIHFEGMNKI